jgi:hypothetical protein
LKFKLSKISKMKYSKVVFVFFLVSIYSFGQDNNLYLDLDHDQKLDSIFYTVENALITCKLSSQKFKAIQSLPLDLPGDMMGIKITKTGFIFFCDFMRLGYENQFRYNPKSKKVQLIGIKYYAFGNVAHDESGQSSWNILTGKYVGNWNYYDEKKEQLIGIPTVIRKKTIKPIFLEDFNDNPQQELSSISNQFFEESKNSLKHAKKK